MIIEGVIVQGGGKAHERQLRVKQALAAGAHRVAYLFFFCMLDSSLLVSRTWRYGKKNDNTHTREH